MSHISHQRFELKFIISFKERDKILKQILPFMGFDKHVKNQFNYEIRTIYFDSPFGKSYYKKKNGIKMRIKFRMRYYPEFQDPDGDFIFIELKKRDNEQVLKRRLKVPFEEAFQIIDNHTNESKVFHKNSHKEDKKILEEIWFHYKRYNLRPVCVICYNRQPYISNSETRFRITFDT